MQQASKRAQCVVDVVAAVHQGQERALGSLPPPHRWYSCVRNTDRVHASCKRAALALAELAQAATCSAAGFAGCCCSLLLCCVPLDAAHSLHLSCALRFIASATAFAFAPRSTFAMAAAARPPWASQCPSLLPAPLRAPPWPPFFHRFSPCWREREPAAATRAAAKVWRPQSGSDEGA